MINGLNIRLRAPMAMSEGTLAVRALALQCCNLVCKGFSAEISLLCTLILAILRGDILLPLEI